MEKLKRVSEYTSLDSDFVNKCKLGIKKFDEFTKRYVEIANEEPAIQINSLENLKREHSAYIYYFSRFYSRILKYKENGEYLAFNRKKLKSECIKEIISSGKNQTTADKIVYDYPKYKEGMDDIYNIRDFLLTVAEAYQVQLNIFSRDIYQSLSVAIRENENNKN